MTRSIGLADVHPAVQAGFNDQDLEGLVALYAPDASLVQLDGTTLTGTQAIRQAYATMLELKGHTTLRSRYAIEAGDLAVLSNEWTFTVGEQSVSAITAEVARRQPDGGWLHVVDHPWASLEPDEAAALAAALEG